MLNKSIIMGRLTADPELRQTQNGTPVCGFTVAINRPPKQGTTQAQADFIDVVAWSKTAEFVTKYFQKGAMIAIVGRLQTRSYEKDGKKIKVTEVIAEEVSFCEGKRDDGQRSQAAPASQQPQAAPQQPARTTIPQQASGDPGYSSSYPDFAPMDDDSTLPF